MTVITNIILVAVYLVMAGATGAYFTMHYTRQCPKDRHNRCDHGLAYIPSLVWPLVIPFAVGAALAGKTDKTRRLEAKREKELAQAEHDSRIAAERRREAEELTLQLQKLGLEKKT